MTPPEESPTQPANEPLVPDHVIPSGSLPPLRYRDLPEPVSLRKMIGPSIILAGLALGSGEFILWPYITYKTRFIFFAACVLGVITQYFINLEITRWSLATGESAIGGFIRLSRKWAPVFLMLNIIPWMLPAWATGAATLVSWLIWGPQVDAAGEMTTLYVTPLAIGGMVMCGAILTAGPVIYETIEKVQMLLVSAVLVLVVVLAGWLLVGRPDALAAQLGSTLTFGLPDSWQGIRDGSAFDDVFTPVALLGALAFAGAGGTTNLGQSNYIRDKGYGMGRYIGRITSPITGQEEAITEVGYHFPATDENMGRWRRWWRAAMLEHFFSFFLTCFVCLVLLTLVSYALFYDAEGKAVESASQYASDINFVWGQSVLLKGQIGAVASLLFLVMGVAILLTTEFGVLDVASRISTDIVKVAWLRENRWWSESRLYYVFLWGTIALGTGILLLDQVGVKINAFSLFKLTASMNGGVMFLYSGLLLYLNRRCLPPEIRTRGLNMAMMIWAFLFFGVFSIWAAVSAIGKMFG